MLEELHNVPVYKYIPTIPALKGINPSDIKITKAGGWSNFNYILTVGDGEKYALRILRESNRNLVNRKHEIHNAQIASTNGLFAKILYYSIKDGVQLLEYIPNNGTLTAEVIKEEEDTWLSAAADNFRDIHHITENVKGKENNITFLQRSFDLLEKLNKGSSEKFIPLFEDLKPLISLLKKTTGKLVFCHNDAYPENFLMLPNGKTMLIDWEYSGLHDPFYDLAKFTTQAKLSQAQIKKFLGLYLTGSPSKENLDRILLYKPIVEFAVSVWSKYQVCSRESFDEQEKIEKEILTKLIETCTQACENTLTNTALQEAKTKLEDSFEMLCKS